MPAPFYSLEIVMASLKQMEATVLGMEQLRKYISDGPGREILDSLIQEAESQIEDVKRLVI